jgi:predicted MFS family arabinose efflux permease
MSDGTCAGLGPLAHGADAFQGESGAEPMKAKLTLSLAGFMATAVTYGPARMGFGLFLPEFRDSFALSSDIAGFIASAGFLGLLIALAAAGIVTSVVGPRQSIITGGVMASLGLALVAVSTDVLLLTIGVALSLSSAGFCWTPYNNAAERIVDRAWRSRALSVISTGTTVGVAVAGVLSLLVALYGLTWRMAWTAFALAAVAMTMLNYVALRPVASASTSRALLHEARTSIPSLRDFAQIEAIPLFACAISIGCTSAVYLSFAVDRVVSSGGFPGLPSEAAPSAMFIAFGVVGLIGLYTGEVEERIGLARLLRLVFLCSVVSFLILAATPTFWPAALASAGLQGACIMMMSAVLSFWSERLFPHLPSVSFTVVLMAYALGSVVGPAAAGIIGEAFGMAVALLTTGAISVLTLPVLRRDLVQAA